MVADIERLESAARLAMGSFEGPTILPANARRPRSVMLFLAAPFLVLTAAGLLAASLF